MKGFEPYKDNRKHPNYPYKDWPSMATLCKNCGWAYGSHTGLECYPNSGYPPVFYNDIGKLNNKIRVI